MSHHNFFCVRVSCSSMCVLIMVLASNWYQSRDEGRWRYEHASEGGLCFAAIFDAHQEQLCGIGYQDEGLLVGVGCVGSDQLEEAG